MNLKKAGMGIFGALGAAALMMPAWAQDSLGDLERVGKPTDGSMWFPPTSGEMAHQGQALNTALIYLSIVISIFVVVLLAIVIIRFRDKGEEPRRFSHNTPLEIAWTLIPVLILVVLAVFSVPALRTQLSAPEADVVIHATGSQWFWSYEYAEDGIAFDSYMLGRDELADYGYQDDEYLLAVDNAVVVPVGKNVVVQVTGSDVIHAWKVPSLYVMTDAVPGRTLVTWFNADKEGVYFGQCSELCGKDHSYMPIVVKVVSEEAYQEWMTMAKEEFAAVSPAEAPALELASNE